MLFMPLCVYQGYITLSIEMCGVESSIAGLSMKKEQNSLITTLLHSQLSNVEITYKRD